MRAMLFNQSPLQEGGLLQSLWTPEAESALCRRQGEVAGLRLVICPEMRRSRDPEGPCLGIPPKNVPQ